MLSNDELERLITVKRSEIIKEKINLGLLLPSSSAPEDSDPDLQEKTGKQIKHDKSSTLPRKKRVKVAEPEAEAKSVQDETDSRKKEKDGDSSPVSYKLEDHIPAGLEKYIRRYLGLPVMLKAGEFSPNNPLIRGERSTGDVLLGLGEYERRRNTLRKIQQQQYREYLDQQAKLKQEAKERAEKERKEREEKERLREEKERERERLREEEERARRDKESQRRAKCFGGTVSTVNERGKVDTGVQVGITRPLSVAVQTDDSELFALSHRHHKKLTEAERELSPRTVNPHEERAVRPAPWDVHDWETKWDPHAQQPKSPAQHARDRLTSELRHTYMPSIFDAEAITLRNQHAEKEAAMRRQFYQQELKNQIQEQQRIREERLNREKMLEQAEMRRLEEQLRVLKAAQEGELERNSRVDEKIRENTADFTIKKSLLQQEIDLENKKLRSGHHTITRRTSFTNDSTQKSPIRNLPFYYPRIQERSNEICTKKPPFSTNIPNSSLFSPNYDVESYLRKNLNPSKEFLLANRLDGYGDALDIENIGNGDKNNVLSEKTLFNEKSKYQNLNGGLKRHGTKNSNNNAYDATNFRNISEDEEILSATKYKSSKLSNFSVNSDIPTKFETLKANLISKDKDDIIEENTLNKNDLRFKNYNEIKENTGQECVLNKYESSKNYKGGKDDDSIQDYQLSNYQTSLRNFNINKEKFSESRPDENENLKNGAIKVTEKALIHENPEEKSRNNNNYKDIDDIPIPVLKHNSSPIIKDPSEVASKLSKDMKLVEGKWKVPAVQKNILKSLPSENGKNVSILTQLGSIRRQLQLEQLRLDNMLPQDE